MPVVSRLLCVFDRKMYANVNRQIVMLTTTDFWRAPSLVFSFHSQFSHINLSDFLFFSCPNFQHGNFGKAQTERRTVQHWMYVINMLLFVWDLLSYVGNNHKCVHQKKPTIQSSLTISAPHILAPFPPPTGYAIVVVNCTITTIWGQIPKVVEPERILPGQCR